MNLIAITPVMLGLTVLLWVGTWLINRRTKASRDAYETIKENLRIAENSPAYLQNAVATMFLQHVVITIDPGNGKEPWVFNTEKRLEDLRQELVFKYGLLLGPHIKDSKTRTSYLLNDMDFFE